jgi:putative transcriptional regulator
VTPVALDKLAPGFLVAVPQLGDPNFQRAVILLMEYGGDGALGLVVNRTAQINMGEVARSQGFPQHADQDDQPVFVGGPVQPERGFVLHTQSEIEESVEVKDGVFVSSSLEALKQLAGEPGARFRLCLGYAGWGPGQLEKELKEGAWIAAPVTRRHVLETPPQETWETVLRDMGIDPAMLLHVGGLH